MSGQPAIDATVTVEIAGGLGNQMFQYAAARALALRHGAKLVLATSFYRRGRHRSFELSRLPIEAEVGRTGGLPGFGRLFRSKAPIYTEPHFHFDAGLATLKPPVRLKGYFQSWRYFAGHENTIRAELSPSMPDDGESLKLAVDMASGDWAALHVRRGDYVTPKNRAQLDMCGVDYYRDAMGLLPADCRVLVFSDDIAWAKAHLPPVRPLIFAGGVAPREGFADLWLMSRARFHIIANSSFSWWGAWLAGRGDGFVVAPERWFGESTVNTSDLVPDNWRRLPNRNAITRGA